MSSKDYDKIAAAEKAIKEKYGEEAVTNPRSNWDEEKEKEYLEQMKELYRRNNNKREWQEKIDVNGVKISKKLLNRESLKNCLVCGAFPKSVRDDVSLIKFDCCSKCYIQYVEDREERWLKGWRPNNGNSL
jgi:hypothetical protein|tara:strand:+ start:1899 stop:2291 length:393 start_codon:yes stop_codon:yes gene_type:complete